MAVPPLAKKTLQAETQLAERLRNALDASPLTLSNYINGEFLQTASTLSDICPATGKVSCGSMQRSVYGDTERERGRAKS
jgi:hypothetical protein